MKVYVVVIKSGLNHSISNALSFSSIDKVNDFLKFIELEFQCFESSIDTEECREMIINTSYSVTNPTLITIS